MLNEEALRYYVISYFVIYDIIYIYICAKTQVLMCLSFLSLFKSLTKKCTAHKICS